MSTALLAVLVKEFRQIFRDKRILPMLFVAPLVQVLAFGYAVNFDVNSLKAAICDFDNTELTRSLGQSLRADGTFAPPDEEPNCLLPEASIRSGNADLVVVFPRYFTRDSRTGESATAQVLVDGTNPVIGRFASGALSQFFSAKGMELARERLETLRGRSGQQMGQGMIQLETRVLFNPEMKSSVFMVPGVSALVLVVITMIATSMGLTREREMGTLEQVVVTPIATWELLAGKILPFVLIGFFDLLAVLGMSLYVFDIPLRGSIALHLLATILYLLNTVGLGLFVSTISKTQQQALLSGFMILMPAILLSGIMTPISSMPKGIQLTTYLNPLRYYGEILRGVMLKGSSLTDLAPSLAGLAALGLGIFFAATLRFSKKVD
jgi:ABC-2 type transport system permease protein